MDEREHLTSIAHLQWTRTGVIGLSIVMRLSALGVDVPALEESFADEE